MKRTKNKKAFLGTAMLIGSAIGAGANILNSYMQKQAMERANREQVRQNNILNNLENANLTAENLANIYNDNAAVIQRERALQENALKLGGRRCKCKGGLIKFI